MSPTIVAAYIGVAAQLLGFINIPVAPEALMTTVQTLTAIGAGLFIIVRRISLGGVNIFGARI